MPFHLASLSAHPHTLLHFTRHKHWIAYRSPNIPWHFRQLLFLCTCVSFTCIKCPPLLCSMEQILCDLQPKAKVITFKTFLLIVLRSILCFTCYSSVFSLYLICLHVYFCIYYNILYKFLWVERRPVAHSSWYLWESIPYIFAYCKCI